MKTVQGLRNWRHVAVVLVASGLVAGCMAPGGVPAGTAAPALARAFADRLADNLAGTRWLPMLATVDGRPRVELMTRIGARADWAEFGTVYITDAVATADAEAMCDVVVQIANMAPKIEVNQLAVNRESNNKDRGWLCRQTGGQQLDPARTILPVSTVVQQ